MKKILLALMVLGLAVASASAGVGINWGTQFGAYDHASPDVVNGDTANSLLNEYAVTWQLIYAGADNTIDLPDTSLGGAGIADDYVTDDDVVWATRTVGIGGGTAPEDSTAWDTWLANQSGNTVYENLAWNTAGFVYQRVFEGTPAALSWYFDSDMQALNTGYTGSPQLPENFFPDTPTAGFQPDQQIPAVPEPATMSLLGLGALVMAIRRRRS